MKTKITTWMSPYTEIFEYIGKITTVKQRIEFRLCNPDNYELDPVVKSKLLKSISLNPSTMYQFNTSDTTIDETLFKNTNSNRFLVHYKTLKERYSRFNSFSKDGWGFCIRPVHYISIGKKHVVRKILPGAFINSATEKIQFIIDKDKFYSYYYQPVTKTWFSV